MFIHNIIIEIKIINADACWHLIESPCLIVLQWQREAGQLVLYRGIRGDDVIGRGTRLTSLGITRHFFLHWPIFFIFFFHYTYTHLYLVYYICVCMCVYVYTHSGVFSNFSWGGSKNTFLFWVKRKIYPKNL